MEKADKSLTASSRVSRWSERLSERGAAAIEYSFLIAIVAVAIIPALSEVRTSANNVTSSFTEALDHHRGMTGPSDGNTMQGGEDDSSSGTFGDDGSSSPILAGNLGGGSNGTTRCQDDSNCSNATLQDGGEDGRGDGDLPHR